MSNYRSSSNSSDSLTIGGCIALAVLIVIGGVIFSVGYRSTEREVTFKVESKERVCDSGNKGCKYLIFASDETYQVGDSYAYGNFNSSDVYGRIKEGKRYKAKVAGWRIGFFSMYPNIVELQNEVPG